MSASLLAAIAGLAALDSLNPATLIAITLILIGSRAQPLPEALGFVVGAFTSVLTVGLIIYLGADAAAASLDGALTWLRRGAFGLAALILFLSAVRSLRPRLRSAVGLPAWFNPLTAVALGVVMTGADLPNAFPYFIAIERLVNADTSTVVAILILAAYAFIYCIPCLVLLSIGLSRGQRVQRLLRRLHDTFGTAAALPASRPKAVVYLGASMLVAYVAATAWGRGGGPVLGRQSCEVWEIRAPGGAQISHNPRGKRAHEHPQAEESARSPAARSTSTSTRCPVISSI